ncbi:MAG: hypothetical protein J6X66_04335 [Lachnospiraceae bacterium]|nr:hypothetical protein [Lachnospiraceae bacterium]
MNMNKSYKHIAAVLALMALIGMLFSVFLASVDTHHHCQGDDCPICECIHQCIESVRHLVGGDLPQTVYVFVLQAVVLMTSVCLIDAHRDTPIGLKVRLND